MTRQGGDRLVAQPGWRCGSGALPAISRAMGVPKVVEPERRDLFRRHCGHQLPSDMGVPVAVVQRQTGAAGEHRVVSRSAVEPLLEQRGHRRGNRDGSSRAPTLWMAQIGAAGVIASSSRTGDNTELLITKKPSWSRPASGGLALN